MSTKTTCGAAQRTRSRLWWAGTAVGALILVAVATAACDQSAGSGAGSDGNQLKAGPMFVGFAQGSSITRPVGSVLTDGIQVLALSGDEPGVIKDVELVGDEGVELLGALIVPPPREFTATQFVEGWPPTEADGVDFGAAVAAEGAEIGTRDDPQGWELLLGLRVAKEGHWHRSAVRVTYTVGDETYRVDLPTELVVCTNENYEVDGRCPPK